MKSIVMLIYVLVYTVNIAGQNNYQLAMTEGIQQLKEAKSPDEMVFVGNYFDRIAEAEVKEWLPRYYSAYIQIIMAFISQEVTAKRQYLDNAQLQIDKAMKINSEESELYTIQGMLYQACIGLDPVNNAQLYSGKAAAAFDDAKSLNSGNPRAHYLHALNVLYTPEQYGGGINAACPLLQHALDLFSEFEPENELMPVWGWDDCKKQAQPCNN